MANAMYAPPPNRHPRRRARRAPGRGPTPPKVRGGMPMFPGGMPDLSKLPPGLNELPPGLAGLDQQLPPGFDPSKLKFPKKDK